MTEYDQHTQYSIKNRSNGFSIVINYSRYQFIPESMAVATACRSMVNFIANEVAEKQGKKILDIPEQKIMTSMGRNGLTGITSCQATANVKWLDAVDTQTNQATPTDLENPVSAQKKTSFNDDLFDLVSHKKSVKTNPDLYVISVGISKYSDVPDVPFADRSGQQFSELAITVLGAKRENVITLINTQATAGRLRGRLRTLLNRLEPKDQLIIYFAGHGVPSKDGKSAYLLAQDGGPGSFEEIDFELGSLYEQIAKSRVGEANIFIDACFSGRSSKETIVFEGVAPVSAAKKRSIDHIGRISIITAGKGDQFANQNKSSGHRLFGYHLMKTLIDDTSISKASDLYAKVREKVLLDSRRLGPEFEQEPELLGNPNLRIFNN